MRPSPLLRGMVLAAAVAACAPAAQTTPTVAPPATPVTTPAVAGPTQSAAPTPTAVPSPSRVVAPPPSAATAAAWERIRPERSPSDREDHTWTVDPSTRIAYLFGGRDGDRVRGDLWAFDLTTDTWRRLDPEGRGPRPRFGHEAAWVDGVGLVVWAGQAGPTTFFDDLWAYDPAADSWRRLPNDGARPVARYGSCAALGPDGRLWISHGFTEDGTRFADTRAYDFTAGTWSDETPSGRAPVNRCLHGCWWTADGRFALYAGQTTGVQALGDLWTLDAGDATDATWTRYDGDLPRDRNLYAFASHGDGVVVFGGRGLRDAYHRDVFTIDGTTLEIRRVRPDGRAPAGRSGATLIDDPAGGRLILFGGRTARGALDDTWELRLP